MGIKKIAAAMAAVVCLAGTVVVPVMAETGIDTFYITKGGGSVVSSFSYKKEAAGGMFYTVKENPKNSITWVQGKEIVNLRGRTINNTKCTGLASRSTRGSGTMYYNSGYGKLNEFYRLAVQYDSSNPYTKLDLICTWTP